VGRAIRRLSPDGPSALIAERRMINSIAIVIAAEIPNSTGRAKKIVNSCTEALAVADGLARRC
jgi:hypothetical protein